MTLKPFGSRRRRLLANALAVLILAGASGVLALLLVGTDANNVTGRRPDPAGPESAEHAAAPAPGLAGPVEPQPAEPAAAIPGEERQARERDRELIDTLTRDLAAARQEMASLKARLAAEAAERLKLSQALQRAEVAAAEHRQALAQEQEETAALARDLESTREQVEYLTAKATQAQAETAEHKEALDRERKRALVLEPPALLLGTPIPVKTTPVSGASAGKAASAPLQQSGAPKPTADEPAAGR